MTAVLRAYFPNLGNAGGFHADVIRQFVAEYAAQPDPLFELVVDLAYRNWRLVPGEGARGCVRLACFRLGADRGDVQFEATVNDDLLEAAGGYATISATPKENQQ